ncbi:hypothetical protein [Burkholderia pseudomallei]|uniref:hypothetical protein n=1 Tax=Burkholderia pseudomallei TaxID=28450 RepID=UPI00057299C6|nr:hypothetical protein [Burkholderia pseudomallei]
MITGANRTRRAARRDRLTPAAIAPRHREANAARRTHTTHEPPRIGELQSNIGMYLQGACDENLQ